MKEKIEKAKIKVMNDAGYSVDSIERFEQNGDLTENTCRNGNAVIWLLLETQELCYDIIEDRYLSDDEIEKELL